MDGYAVLASDARPGTMLPIADHVVAGDSVHCHRAGSASAIATGAPLPDGADTVIPWEDIDVHQHAILIGHAPIAPGEHIFPAGDDARRGDILARTGEIARPGVLALLSAAGHARVAVRRRPRVRLIVTGDELVGAGSEPRPGQIRDSNSLLLRGMLKHEGADVVAVIRCGDSLDDVRTALLDAARDADIIVTTGGASTGPRDNVKHALRTLEATFAFESIALRPAKPAGLAQLQHVPVIVLPETRRRHSSPFNSSQYR